MAQKKGFVHAIEGVIAALLLLTYLSTIDLQPIEKKEWGLNMLKQTGSEYVNSFNRANLSKMIYEENGTAVAEINRYFFAGTRISMSSASLPKTKIRVGIISNYTGDPVMRFNALPTPNATCAVSGWASEYLCIINGSATNRLGKTVILADRDGKKPNARLDYDAVYVDINDNGRNDSNEGPFVDSSIFQIGNDFYSVSYIDNATKSAVFLNASWALAFASNVPPVNINGRNVGFMFLTALPKKDLSQFDAIIIVGKANISGYEAELRKFLQSGKGIIEISNMTDENFNNAQKSIFGFSKISYNIIGNSNAAAFDRDIVSLDPVGIKDYFAGSAMKVATPTKIADTAGYDVNALPSPADVRLGVFKTGGAEINIALANSPSYDSFFIDSDNDKNFSNPSSDSTAYYAGDRFSFSLNTYFIREIDPAGNYMGARPFDNHTFLNAEGNSGVFIWNDNGQAMLEENNYYSISANAINSNFSVNFYPSPVLSNPGNLPPGTHTYAQFNQTNGKFGSFAFNVSLTNATGKYSLLNIDQGYGNYNAAYRGFREGPFSNGDIITIGPEQYVINISPSGNSASFKLLKRQAVPVSVANYLYAGRTLWTQDILDGGQDAWNYIRAAIIWASDKKPEPENIRAATDIVSIKRVFVSSGDMYLPYEVETQLGHWG